jgi:zinc transporter
MEDNPAILYAAAIEGNGYGRRLHGDEISKLIKDDALAWVHLDAGHPKSRLWLEKEITYLDHIIIDALLAEETRPRMLEFDKGVLLNLRGVNLNENADPEDMVSIRLWIDENRIISLRHRSSKAAQDIQNDLDNGKGPKNAGDFICKLTTRLLERMKPTFSIIDDQLDAIEEKIIENPDKSERKTISDIRKDVIIYRRYIAPQRDALGALRNADQTWLNHMHKRQLQESHDRLTRYVEDLETMRDRAQVIKDELMNALSDRMNKNMYMLSVIAAIFLPLGFLTGLLGINVAGIPGAENTHAFAIFCTMLIGIIALQITLFKKLKWF